MALSWNEIRKRAIEFSKKWEAESRERSESQSFWYDFFLVFGVPRKRLASYEEHVKKFGGKHGFIDLFWRGKLLVEHKSKGEDLNKAFEQAIDYFPGISDKELPKYILVSDFERLRLYDLETSDVHEFILKEFHEHIHLFGFIAGYEKKVYQAEDPANIKAAELMGYLHDALFENGYQGESLEVFLIRILFCVFAEDTEIFEPHVFEDYLNDQTREDGTDVGVHLSLIFQVLNTPIPQRQKNLNESLQDFPYVNGHLFETSIHFPAFNSELRSILIEVCEFDWGLISPAIFGAMFQSIMDKEKRRDLGAHYTSEQNILKVIEPLFLDKLKQQFETIKHNKKKVKEFHIKLSSLRFFDPACGCGNFLIITYRELRLLEIEILKVLLGDKSGHIQLSTDVAEHLSLIDVDQFYGIEFEDFPSKIAEVAMWLVDHQMNQRLSSEFGFHYVRLPLKKSATIIHGNALEIDWQTIIPKEKLSYIFGNPPFVGSKYQNEQQRAEIGKITKDVKGGKILDYVTAWYFLAARFVQGTNISVAFVSTNSIAQGAQVGVLWEELQNEYKMIINFAHQTFKWSNEAKGKAAVHCVIIGFSQINKAPKIIYEYFKPDSEAHEKIASNINPYLVDGASVIIAKRTTPICDGTPKITVGSQPIDNGNYLFTTEEKMKFLEGEPQSNDLFRKWVGAEEFLQGKERWCLWLGDCPPDKLRNLPHCLKRVENVRDFRLNSKRIQTQKVAGTPTRFYLETFPKLNYLIIPKVSSARRNYIPIGYLKPEIMVSDLVFVVMNTTLFHFGLLSSTMHMAWVRYVAGRLKSDYRYSASIVYNNFPWPNNQSEKQVETVQNASKVVLDTRKNFPNSTLADLYNPRTTPSDLLKAHQTLDKAVDLCYRKKKFETEIERVEFLFKLYGDHIKQN